MSNWLSTARPSSAMIPVERFLDEFVFTTKGDGYGILLAVPPIDPEGRTRQQLDSICARVAQTIRVLPQGITIYQYTLRKRGYDIPYKVYGDERIAWEIRNRIEFLKQHGELGDVQLFWCLYVPGATHGTRGAEQSHKSLRMLHRAVGTLRSQLSDLLRFTPVSALGVSRFFSYLLGLEPRLIRTVRSMQDVHKQLAGAPVSWHKGYLKVGHRYVEPLSMVKRPKGTRPNMLGELLKIDADFIFCSILQLQTPQAVRKEVSNQETFLSFFRTNYLVVAAHLGTTQQIEKTASSVASEKTVDKLAGVLDDLNLGHQYGRYGVFGLVHSLDLDSLREVLPKFHAVFANPGEAELVEETLGAMSIYQGMLPGNLEFSWPRSRAWMKDTHYAKMSHAVFAPCIGSVTSESLDEYLAIYETHSKTPFFLDPYHNGLRGLLVVGAPRRGKSMNGNYLVDCEVKFDGFTWIFDIGRSYETTVRSHGGTVTDISKNTPLGNPFSLEPTEDNLQFLFQFIRMLIVKSGVSLDADEENILYKKIKLTYKLPPPVRRLKSLILPERMQRGLAKWTEGGVYGRVFDNTAPAVNVAKVQCFEFEAVSERHQDLIEPALFWITRLINNVIHDKRLLGIPKHLLFDEVWKQLKDPQLLEMVIHSLKTGGKHLAGVTLLTHLVDDLGEHAALIKNACPMIMFLGDETFDREKYREFFQLNDEQLDLIGSLKMRELALKTPDLFKVLVLNLSEQKRMQYSTRPKDIIARAQAAELAAHDLTLATVGGAL